MTVYFRRPQTAFVQDEGSQKPQAQWKLVADGHEEERKAASMMELPSLDGNGTSDMNTSGSSLGLGGGSGHHQEDFGDLVEKDPPPKHNQIQKSEDDTTTDNSSTSASAKNSEAEAATHDETDNNGNSSKEGEDESEHSNTDEDLATSLDKRLQLEIKHHPESVLLCGYFHEEVVDDCLALSTYLPGVHARELRVYYGDSVLKIAGARALYNLVQRFERSFALDERLVETEDMRAVLHEGMLMIRVPLVKMPPPPVKIKVHSATPMIHLMNRNDLFCLDIDVPGVHHNELTVEYNNGALRLIWDRLEPAMKSSSSKDKPNPNNSNGNDNTLQAATKPNQKTMMRFEKIIHINTLQIDTGKITAYLDRHTQAKGVLTIVAPKKYKRFTRPIQVMTAKELTKLENDVEGP